jgi:hypothetical protein
MAYFAVISGNEVINLVVAATRDDAELVTGALCVEYNPEVDQVKIGDTFESDTDTFTDPVK